MWGGRENDTQVVTYLGHPGLSRTFLGAPAHFSSGGFASSCAIRLAMLIQGGCLLKQVLGNGNLNVKH